MATDHIRYDILAQQALRGVMRDVLTDAAKNGLPGEHHFYISFDTKADGVKMSDRLREQHPQDITIILQHQFWDLAVTDDHFEVGLSFNGVPEKLLVPFEAVKGFFDPSVQFGLQFETIAAQNEDGDEQSADGRMRRLEDRSRLGAPARAGQSGRRPEACRARSRQADR